MMDDSQLLRLVADVLNRDEKSIGMDSNFFTLGGDSMTAMQLVRLAKSKRLSLTVDDVFDNPTVLGLARVCSCKAMADKLPSSQQKENKVPVVAIPDYESLRGRLSSKLSQEILRIHPITELQRMCLFRTRFRYFCVPLPQTIDRGRLRAACQNLIQRHESLRTVFVVDHQNGMQDEVFQLVLRPFDVEFKECSGIKDHVMHCYGDNADAVEPPIDGESVFQAQLATLRDLRTFLILRMSHAQWDGCSLPIIANDLSAAYNGIELPPTNTFIEHARAAQLVYTEKAFNTWENVLKGSEMTPLTYKRLPVITETPRAEDSKLGVVHVRRRLPFPPTPLNITRATMFKTAWAMILMRFFTPEETKKDVVFGQASDGRGLGIPHEDRIVGTCLNIIPVRVRMAESTTRLELLHQVQRQHLDTKPFENVGLGTIISRCTSWPAGTSYGSYVRFQSYNTSPTCWFDGVPCKGTLHHLPNTLPTVNVAAFPDKEGITVQIMAPESIMGEKEADFVLDKLCEIFQELGT
ncbi:hypothetical protein FE257_005854 [Aspergillus nanangensis]|uniref:Carrier domain-containing protein n=1 Tax=Aspergillus nanangensis TaxID=2582783 RepID=A0AAD4CPR0_ASPNN|nr:hypothetical protein FE257_005854 [Aspergillus nanangensis]